ncbi:phage protein Gp37/Gp68 [Burkholderiaceae bacterium 26]|nr:phage protein Gp37/Gp68 [Burkholderiaceae bacterium 26]
MAATTSIEWTEMTWNPVTGCVKVSQGCKHCYAETMAKRLHAMGAARYSNKFAPTLHWDLVDVPRRWKKPRTVFVNSMSDLFQEDVPLEFIQAVFQTMVECPQHTFQILTKRAERLLELATSLPWPSNVWMGVSVEDSRVVDRIHYLAATPAQTKFLSCEPLIGPLEDLCLTGIDWVIVGGESGQGARPMEEVWVQSIRRQCRSARVAFFFKQWGGVRKGKNGRQLNGRTYDEMPRNRKVIPIQPAA